MKYFYFLALLTFLLIIVLQALLGTVLFHFVRDNIADDSNLQILLVCIIFTSFLQYSCLMVWNEDLLKTIFRDLKLEKFLFLPACIFKSTFFQYISVTLILIIALWSRVHLETKMTGPTLNIEFKSRFKFLVISLCTFPFCQILVIVLGHIYSSFLIIGFSLVKACVFFFKFLKKGFGLRKILKDLKKFSGMRRTHHECSICLESFKENEDLVEFTCNKEHIFHEDCIRAWIEKKTNCPICRKEMFNNDMDVIKDLDDFVGKIYDIEESFNAED